ncbi:hypothetical protein OQ257_11430 [Actinobacillus equuli subsp. equuli]|uniref:Uncharacterized protein n=1 Tax=Actinobacillus equuli subsp. equuli TaxID=202947 RepID=A0A9X4G4M8_ACTEU|nr:hypothetical protein [Actinobacillus equuli]MDE8035767.1 hypothetical protein [Actinobacillus equuli subsp. equuli]
MFNKQILKRTAVVIGAIALAGTANAQGYADIAANVDLNDAKTSIIAVGVAIGGFLAVGIGIRAVLGMMKRL